MTKRIWLCAGALLVVGANSSPAPIPVNPIRDPGVPDYPARALRQEIAGRAGYAIHIAPDGRIESCEIVATSGATTLDDATCQFVRRAFRFGPVRDEKGKPAPGIYEGSILWSFPPDDELPVPKVVDFSYEYVVGADGAISQCRQMARMGEPPDFHPCDAPGWTVPLKTRLGTPVATRVVVTQTVQVQPVEAPVAAEEAIDYREQVP